MNTRGLTELVILNVGCDPKVLDRTLFTLMVLMALDHHRDDRTAAARRLPTAAGRSATSPTPSGPRSPPTSATGSGRRQLPRRRRAGRHRPRPRRGRVPGRWSCSPARPAQAGRSAGVRLRYGPSELLVDDPGLAELHALAARGAERGVRDDRVLAVQRRPAADLTRMIIDDRSGSRRADAETRSSRRTTCHAADGPVHRRSGRRDGARPWPASDGGPDPAAALQVATQLAVEPWRCRSSLAGGQGRRGRIDRPISPGTASRRRHGDVAPSMRRSGRRGPSSTHMRCAGPSR